MNQIKLCCSFEIKKKKKGKKEKRTRFVLELAIGNF